MGKQSSIKFPKQDINEDYLERIKQLINSDDRVNQTLAIKLARGQKIEIKEYIIKKAIQYFENCKIFEEMSEVYANGNFQKYPNYIHTVFTFRFAGLAIVYEDDDVSIRFTCHSDKGIEMRSIVWEWEDKDCNDLVCFIREHFSRFMKEHFFLMHKML